MKKRMLIIVVAGRLTTACGGSKQSDYSWNASKKIERIDELGVR